MKPGLKAAAVVAAVIAAAGATTAAVLLTGESRADRTLQIRPQATRDVHALATRFSRLSHAHSNRCGMPASALDAMPDDARLQGSCRFPMDRQSYFNQIRELKRYAAVAVVPKDPYDIPLSLAKRLLAYQSIELTAEQQHRYNRAVPLSETNGPCCCPCWRWDAFRGQAKFLIARRNYSAKQIGEVWTLEEGCGGPSHLS